MHGGCQCGAVRYEVDPASILTLYCCHCRECQRQSASAFAMSMKLDRSGFQLMCGTLGRWQRATDRGGTSRAHFCTECGCRIYHDTADDAPMISLKAGSLDDALTLRPIGHIWTSRAHGWVPLDQGSLIYEGQPDTYDTLIDAWRRHVDSSR